MILRRRLLGKKRVVTVTFHGNGGLTSAGEDTVTEAVPAGTAWRHVTVPNFAVQGTAKQQSGFTLIQGDDDTLVMSDYILTGDLTVYASYTVIETGVVTRAGEIHSAASWANKYARYDSPDTLYEYGSPGEDYSGYRDGFNPDNLIEFVYFKAGSRVFALRSSYTENGITYGSYIPCVNYIPDPPYRTQDALSDIVFWADGTNSEEGKIPSAYSSSAYPVVSIPGDYTLLINELYGNGKLYTDILYNKLTEGGYTPVAIASLYQQLDPFGRGEHMYAASLYEVFLFISNKAKFIDIFRHIDSVIRPVSGGAANNNIAKAVATYGNGGFSSLYDSTSTGTFSVGSSNLLYRYDGGNYYWWRNLRYYNGEVGMSENSFPLSLMDLSGLF